MKRLLLVAGLFSLLLAGCGFHLRRAPDLPLSMRKMYISAPGSNGDLLRELRRGLASDDTEVLATPEGATAILSIISVSHSSRPLALNRVGVALLYQVQYEVEFSLTVRGAVILEPQSVILNRNYTYSVSNAIANEEQELALNQALSKDVSQFIVTRVVAAARSLPKYLMAVPSTHAAPAAASRALPAAGSSAAPQAATTAVPVSSTRAPAV
jgi:LPS-assembly lipoprotein